MADSQPIRSRLRTRWSAHSARTAVAATVSLYVARLFGLPEAYWAPVTTLIVMQSTLGAAFTISVKRFIGTALGCGLGVLLATHFGSNGLVFGAAILGVGLLCAVLGLDKAAYRFAGITLAIVMLVGRAQPAWVVGIHRFVEVSAGITLGLAVTAIWPEEELSRRDRSFPAQ